MKAFSREPVSVAAASNGLVFIGLSIADGWLTGQLVAMGGYEVNPVVTAYGSNMLVKGFLALAIALVLIRLGKAELLWVVNICMLAIVLWNTGWLLYLA